MLYLSETRGIDVSEYQGNIDWQRVRSSGIDFAILRCGYGRFSSQKDDRFEQNYINAKRAGVNVGAYLFSYAASVENALEEAENCLNFIRNKQFEYPICYDVEAPSQQRLSLEENSRIADAFCSTLERNGYYVSIYSNLYFLNNKLSAEVKRKYDIWLAQWAPTPTYGGNFGMWQYSATGSVNGINGSVDLDVAFKDYPSVMRRNGLNGFSTDTTPSPAPIIEAGRSITLSAVPIYSTSLTNRVSARVSGTYYIYDGQVINGRIRITTRPSFVNRRPTPLFVTGWINTSDLV